MNVTENAREVPLWLVRYNAEGTLNIKVLVIPWVVRLYGKIIHEL